MVDSAPIPVCTYMRSRSCRTVAGAAYCRVMIRPPGQSIRLSAAPHDDDESSCGSMDGGSGLAPRWYHDTCPARGWATGVDRGRQCLSYPCGRGMIAATAPDCAYRTLTSHSWSSLACASALPIEQRAPDDCERVECTVYRLSCGAAWVTQFGRFAQPRHHAVVGVYLVVHCMGILASVEKLALPVIAPVVQHRSALVHNPRTDRAIRPLGRHVCDTVSVARALRPPARSRVPVAPGPARSAPAGRRAGPAASRSASPAASLRCRRRCHRATCPRRPLQT